MENKQKKLSPKIQNYIFIGIALACAVVLYLITRPKANEANVTPEPTLYATPEAPVIITCDMLLETLNKITDYTYEEMQAGSVDKYYSVSVPDFSQYIVLDIGVQNDVVTDCCFYLDVPKHPDALGGKNVLGADLYSSSLLEFENSTDISVIFLDQLLYAFDANMVLTDKERTEILKCLQESFETGYRGNVTTANFKFTAYISAKNESGDGDIWNVYISKLQ